MALIGVNLSIDVTKIDKARLYKGEKGTYLNVTAFIDTKDKDQYGNSGMLTQSVSKEERDSGVKGEILGNSKVFMLKESQPARPTDQDTPHQQQNYNNQPDQQRLLSQQPNFIDGINHANDISDIPF